MSEKVKKDAVSGAATPDDTVLGGNSVAQARAERLREASRFVGGNKAMSAKSGVPLSTLNNYLAGGDPKVSNFSLLAEAAGVSLDWLINGVGLGPGVSPPPPPPVSMFRQINIDQLARAMLTARDQFAARGSNPNWREQAQVVSLIYDMITAQETGRIPGEPQS